MTRVVKIGGRAQQAAELVPVLAATWREMRGALVIVHGGGNEVTELQRLMGREPQFVDGRRVTTEDDIALLRMTLSGVVNKRLVAALVGAGVPAVGISGEDAAVLSAVQMDRTMGRTGQPEAVNATLVSHLLAGGFLPVISPIARDASSNGADAFNVNGDDAAAAVAVALGATELLLVADVPGVLDAGRPVSSLGGDAVRALVASGTVTDGMIAKLEAAVYALTGGVPLVRIGDLTAVVDDSFGTRIIASSVSQSLSPAFA
ncbi:MAG: acetylglutamate kinase [Gemmatimonadota bacterium]|nr:acetylglutamate kinase [Gemmatimonadota bacterium]